jgi:4-phytase/acid phosphatase
VQTNSIVALMGALLLAAPSAGAELKYVAIVTRHGVRSPTWDAARLKEYSAEPWPDWGVPPGNLTPQGRKLILLMGAYYRDWLASEQLIRRQGCADAGHVYIHADTDQRTIDTGRAFAESLLPGCAVPVHSQPEEEKDPLFSGVGTPDPELALKTVRERLGPDPNKLLADHKAALDTLYFILGRPSREPAVVEVSMKGKSVELKGPLAAASTLSEVFLLEYSNGMKGASLGWGRLTEENLQRVMELHALTSDLMRRDPYLARVRGSNLLEHVLRSMEQAVSGKAVAGALGQPGDEVLLISGHDTNLSNLSGMLGLSWKLPGYQPDDTPPGGALIFSLWKDAGGYVVKLRYTAQTLDQMRDVVPLSAAAPPASQELSVCGSPSCSWEAARSAMEKAIDLKFTAR